MSYLSVSMNQLIQAVKRAGKSLIRDFNEIEKLQSSVRSRRDFVMSAVSRVDNILKTDLGKAHPDYPFYVAGKPEPTGPYYVVSNLDGVINFAHALPQFAISAAICQKGTVLAGVVYNPVGDELYFAEKGNGAYKEGFRNQERLRVSAVKELPEALFAAMPSASVLPAEAGQVRVLGAAGLDLAYVASGRVDVAVSLGNDVENIAAGILLVKEAGGYVYDRHQKDIRTEDLAAVLRSGNLVAVNANLSAKVYNLLNQ